MTPVGVFFICQNEDKCHFVNSTILSRSGSLRCFPCLDIPFRTVILFSRCGSSMNYPKSTPKRPPTPYIHKVGNHPGKLFISTLSELW